MRDKREYAAVYYSGHPENSVVLLVNGEHITEYALDHNEELSGEGKELAGEFLGSPDVEKTDEVGIRGLRIYECPEPTWHEPDEEEIEDGFDEGYWIWEGGIVRYPTAEELAEMIAGVWCPVW